MSSDDPLLIEFLGRNLKPNTKARYNYVLRRYIESTGLTPSELISQAEDDEDNNIRLRKRRIKTYLDNHIDYLTSLDYSVKNIRLNIQTIRVFYNYFEIQIPKITLPTVRESRTVEDIPNGDEIREVLSHANTKYTAIILLMLSSGMGSAEVLSLKIHDLLKASKQPLTSIGELTNIQPKTILEWEVTRVKTGQKYYTFSTPETTTKILEYLGQQTPSSVDDHLFRSEKGEYMGKPLHPVTLQKYFMKLNDKCGFTSEGNQRFFKSHNLRKFFATTAEQHIPHMATRHMMGHKFGSVEGAYFLRNQKALRNEYMKVVEYLAILEPLTVINDTDERLEEMEKSFEEKLKKQELESQARMVALEKKLLDEYKNDLK